jgi:hypothetical protein
MKKWKPTPTRVFYRPGIVVVEIEHDPGSAYSTDGLNVNHTFEPLALSQDFREDALFMQREEWKRFNESAAAFNVTDGINGAEALFLGEAYFSWQLGGCGFPQEPQDGGTEWRLPVRFGVAGTKLPNPVRVDKRTGKVSYAAGESIDPKALIEIERKRIQDLLRESEPRFAPKLGKP